MELDVSSKKSFFVLGMGRSGVAVSLLLADRGFPVVAFDDDPALLERLATNELRATKVGLASGDDVLDRLVRSDCLVVSPGVPLDHPIVRKAKADGTEIAGELEIAYHFCSSRIIGVTGTNGKSTVVQLLGHILEKALVPAVVAGNIGTPLAAVVREAEVPANVILEISSFQLDTIDDFRADVAVLLNVTADHLDRYEGSFDNYVASKARILNRSDARTVFVYNDDDAACRSIASGFSGEKIPFSSSHALDRGVFLHDGVIVRRLGDAEEGVLDASEFPPVGIHNLENAMAAVAAVTPLGVEVTSVQQALRSYRPLPHRMEPVRVVEGVNYINDSKATNVDATIKSIVSIDGPLIVILGGLDKDGDFRPLTSKLSGVKHVILIGKASDTIESVLAGHVAIHRAVSMVGAVGFAASTASPGDTVLLAPACASFDMFENYAARGQAFRDAVNAL